MPLAIQVHTDADILARLVAGSPTPPRLDHQGGGVIGFGADLDHLAA